jgi:hypothetical protein
VKQGFFKNKVISEPELIGRIIDYSFTFKQVDDDDHHAEWRGQIGAAEDLSRIISGILSLSGVLPFLFLLSLF